MGLLVVYETRFSYSWMIRGIWEFAELSGIMLGILPACLKEITIFKEILDNFLDNSENVCFTKNLFYNAIQRFAWLLTPQQISTSKHFWEQIIQNPKNSRREWMRILENANSIRIVTDITTENKDIRVSEVVNSEKLFTTCFDYSLNTIWVSNRYYNSKSHIYNILHNILQG